MSFGFYSPYTVDHTKVTGSLTLFEVPVVITDARLKDVAHGGNVQSSSGFDIVPHADSALTTRLHWRVDFYDPVNGVWIAWVTVDVDDTTDVDIFIGYGDSGITTDQSTPADAAADEGWGIAMPLNDKAANTVVRSLSGDSNDGASDVSNTEDLSVATLLGTGLALPTTGGTPEGIVIPDNTDQHSTSDFTVAITIKIDQYFYGSNFTAKGALGEHHVIFFASGQSSIWILVNKSGTYYAYSLGVLPSASVAHRYVLTLAGGSVVSGFVDGAGGALSPFFSSAQTFDNTQAFTIGPRAAFKDGVVASQLRFSPTVAKTSDWVATDWNAHSDPASFATLGAEVSAGGGGVTATGGGAFDLAGSGVATTDLQASGGGAFSLAGSGSASVAVSASGGGAFALGGSGAFWSNGFSYRKKITIDHTKVSGGPLTDFPIFFCATDADLADVGNGGKVQSSAGDDIRFELPDGTKLDHEIDTYDPATGALNAHVRIPTLSGAVDTVLFIYYGKTVGSPESNPTGVWDSHYLAVYHFGDGTTLSLLDSTANANHGTNHGCTAAFDSVLGGCIHIDGDNGHYVQVDSLASPLGTGSVTVEATVQPDRIIDGSHGSPPSWDIFSIGDDNVPNGNNFYFEIWDNLAPWQGAAGGVVYTGATPGVTRDSVHSTTTTWPANTPQWLSYRIASGGTAVLDIFKNGVDDAAGHVSTNPRATQDAATSARIGRSENVGASTEWWVGLMGELRISNVARTSGWILTTVNTLKNCSTFFSVGSEEQNVGGATGGGAFALAGSGTASVDVLATGTGAFALAGSGSSSAAVSATGSGAFSISGSGTGSVEAQGTGGGAFTLSGSGTAVSSSDATGSGVFTLSGSGVAVVNVEATGSGAFTLAGSGSATVPAEATGSGAFTIAGSGTGSVDALGSGGGAFTLSGSGTGSASTDGTGSGSLTFAGSGTALVSILADGTGVFSMAGSGTASVEVLASGSGAFTIAGTGTAAVDTVEVLGTGAGSFSLSGSGIVVVDIRATGAGAFVLAGSATATVGLSAAGGGAFILSGSGLATVTEAGTGSGLFTIGGSGTASVAVLATGGGAFSLSGSGAVDLGFAPVLITGGGSFTLSGAGSAVVVLSAHGAGALVLTGHGVVSISVIAAGGGAFHLAGGGVVGGKPVDLSFMRRSGPRYLLTRLSAPRLELTHHSATRYGLTREANDDG